MDLPFNKPTWVSKLSWGSHACFFYTTLEEFFVIAKAYLEEGLSSQKERCLWILPPRLSFQKAKQELQQHVAVDVDALLRLRRLLFIPWDKWYGQEVAIQELMNKGRRLLKETLRDGFTTLRILGHSPAKSSPYWKDFLVYEETVARGHKPKPYISLCAYSLVDCPAPAITSIAANHNLCLIHHGAEWEWLPNKVLHSSTILAR